MQNFRTLVVSQRKNAPLWGFARPRPLNRDNLGIKSCNLRQVFELHTALQARAVVSVRVCVCCVVSPKRIPKRLVQNVLFIYESYSRTATLKVQRLRNKGVFPLALDGPRLLDCNKATNIISE